MLSPAQLQNTLMNELILHLAAGHSCPLAMRSAAQVEHTTKCLQSMSTQSIFDSKQTLHWRISLFSAVSRCTCSCKLEVFDDGGSTGPLDEVAVSGEATGGVVI